MCNSELRSFERRLADFRSRNVEVVAISVDSPEESGKLARSQGYTFPMLSDPRAQTIRAYGILHPHGGVHEQDIARPAEFLVDPAGTIRWENLTEDLLVRLRPGQALSAIDALPATPGSSRSGPPS